MSNYLSRLVARSLDPASAIQPRLASRFEPGAQSLAHDGHELVVSEQTVDVAGRSPDSEATSESRPQRPVPIPASENIPALKSGKAAAEKRAQLAVQDFEETSSRLIRDQVEAKQNFEETPAPSIFDELKNQSRQRNESVVDASPTVTEEPVVSGPLLKIRRSVSPVTNSAVQSSVRSRNNDWIHSTPAPSIVQVSIGRVEVRAVLPAPPVSGKPSQAANKVSLQDHLRNGGRR